MNNNLTIIVGTGIGGQREIMDTVSEAGFNAEIYPISLKSLIYPTL